MDSVQWLADHEGAKVDWLPVDELGRVRPETLRDALGSGDDVALTTVMWANNEVGTVQPIAELAAAARERGVPCTPTPSRRPVSCRSGSRRAARAGPDHHRPQARRPDRRRALLLAKPKEPVFLDPVPLLHGGGQERDVRSGTLDAPPSPGSPPPSWPLSRTGTPRRAAWPSCATG